MRADERTPIATGTPTVGLHDEVSRLARCIVFQPGAELDRLLPIHIEGALHDPATGLLKPNPDYLLFDDIVLTAALCDEHRIMRSVLGAAIGDKNVLDLRLMLQRLLGPVELRKRVINAVLVLESELFGAPLPDAKAELERLPSRRIQRSVPNLSYPCSNPADSRHPMPEEVSLPSTNLRRGISTMWKSM